MLNDPPLLLLGSSFFLDGQSSVLRRRGVDAVWFVEEANTEQDWNREVREIASDMRYIYIPFLSRAPEGYLYLLSKFRTPFRSS